MLPRNISKALDAQKNLCPHPAQSASLPDGTTVKDVIEFKAWLVANIDQFSQCLAEKLMTYATGRVPNYAERHEIEGIVTQNIRKEEGFRDLVLDLITSKTFRTK
jgi:hypothetical protein